MNSKKIIRKIKNKKNQTPKRKHAHDFERHVLKSNGVSPNNTSTVLQKSNFNNIYFIVVVGMHSTMYLRRYHGKYNK